MKNINIVKIWSDSINESNLEKLLNDIEKYEKETWEKFLIISSWAVKLWKEQVLKRWWDLEKFTKSSLASIWQHFLMQTYDKLSWNRLVWEVLLDDYINENYINTFIQKITKKSIIKDFANRILRPC